MRRRRSRLAAACDVQAGQQACTQEARIAGHNKAMLLSNARGGFSFLRGGSAYSAGVAAAPGFTIEHVRLARAVPLPAGFQLVERHLRAAGRPLSALCAVALRSPAPFSFAGFKDFNAGYVGVLKSWDILVDGINPVARTNVAPVMGPPSEPSLYSFAYTVAAEKAGLAFVVSGAGEMPEGSSGAEDIVRRGETSGDAMAAKARCVLGLVEGRMRGLGANWDQVTATNIYTEHDVNALLAREVLPYIGAAGQHGVTWHYARPPIVEIEYEMDLFGGTRDRVIQPE